MLTGNIAEAENNIAVLFAPDKKFRFPKQNRIAAADRDQFTIHNHKKMKKTIDNEYRILSTVRFFKRKMEEARQIDFAVIVLRNNLAPTEWFYREVTKKHTIRVFYG